MRFDLLDEYSTLVPFGLGVSRKAAIQHRAVPAQDCDVPAKAVKRGTIANFTSHLVLLRKLPGAIRQMVLSSYRHLVAKYSCLF
jgi:hypothetical protein